MKQKIIVTVVFALFGLISTTVLAQTGVYSGTTVSSDQVGGFDSYGDHVAANSEWMMVASPRESIDFDNDGLDPAQGDINVGAVYVYRRSAGGLVFHSKIEGEGNNVNPATSGDRLGSGIVLQGNVMFVGAVNDNNFPGQVDPLADDFTFAGQVYVYNYDAGADEWVLVQKLTSDEPNSFGSFGARTDSTHVELFSFGNGQTDPTIALIGEVENGSGFPPVLHVFKRKKNSNQWKRVQKAGAPSGEVDSSFGDKVEGVGKVALVTEATSDGLLDTAVVHVFRINPNGIVKTNGNLQPVQTLDSPAGPNDPNDCFADFGQGMSAANGIAVLGDPCDDTAANNAGAIHIYTVDNNGNNDPLTLRQTLLNPTGLADTFFGQNFGNGKQSVSTDGDLILVGTPNLTGFPPQLDVEMYAADANGTFVNTDSIPSPSPGIPDNEIYGQSVHLMGDGQFAVGQWSNGTTFQFNGSVFLFDIQ